MREKAIHLGKRIISHELISGSSLILLGTMFSNFFSFLFNLFLARSLSYVEYGEYIALISIITLVGIPAQSVLPVLVQFSSRFFNKGEKQTLKEFYFQASRLLIIVSVILFVGFIMLTPILQHFFHITSPVAIILAGIIIAFAYITVPNIAFLQGLLRFDFLSFTSVLSGFFKLAAGLLFIYLGWKTIGALGAVFVSFLIPSLLAFIPLLSYISFRRVKGITIPVREIVRYAFPAAVSIFCLSAFTSTDLLLVKHFFNGNDAGLYGGLSLIGRIIFYFTAPISTVMFPLIIKRYEEGRNFQTLLYLALLLVLLPSITLIAIYFVIPHTVIDLFLGGRGYQTIAQYLGIYGIFLCIFSLMNVLVTFFLSLKKTKVVTLLLVGSIAQAALISLFHSSFWEIINVSLGTVLVLFVLLLLYYTKEYVYKKNH